MSTKNDFALELIQDMIEILEKKIIIIKDDINFFQEDGYTKEVVKKRVRLEVKVVNEMIIALNNLKNKYPVKFECVERDYK